MLFQRQLQVFRLQVRGAQQRAGFRHTVTGVHVNAEPRGRVAQALGQCAAADQDMPVAEVCGLDGFGGHHHLHDGWHTVRHGDPVSLDQVDQQLRLVAARINLFDPQHGGSIGHTPGVNVEHGGNRHIHGRRAQQGHFIEVSNGAGHGQGVQYQLPVAEIDAFGIAGGACGVEGGGHAVFVKVREIELVVGFGQQGFVLAKRVNRGCCCAVAVGQLNPGFDGFDFVFNAFDDRHKVVMYQHHIVFRVVHGVHDLLRRQTHVYRVQDGTDHRDGKEAFQVARGIPVHDRHGVARLYTGTGQGVGQPVNAVNQVFVGVLAAVGVDDFLVRVVTRAGHQQPFDQQRILVGIVGRFKNPCLCHL